MSKADWIIKDTVVRALTDQVIELQQEKNMLLDKLTRYAGLLSECHPRFKISAREYEALPKKKNQKHTGNLIKFPEQPGTMKGGAQ